MPVRVVVRRPNKTAAEWTTDSERMCADIAAFAQACPPDATWSAYIPERKK